MAEEYDRLSPLGEEQARSLGAFWATHQITFDHVFCGPAKRHSRTMEIAIAEARSSGLPWPEPVVVPELDEFDAFQVMKRMMPVLLEQDPETRRMWEEFQRNQQSPEAGRQLQKVFERVARHWCSGEFDMPEVESWQQFRSRIRTALNLIRRTTGSSKWSVAFTSGGPIAATIAEVLDLQPAKAIEFVWLSRNCSWAEFYYSGDRFSMGAFNSFPHLNDRKLLTYR